MLPTPARLKRAVLWWDKNTGERVLLKIRSSEVFAILYWSVCDTICGVDEPEQSGTTFRYLLFSRKARSSTYCQISQNAFYLPLRHLFSMDDNYEFMTPAVLITSSRKLHNRCTLYRDIIDIWRKQKFRTVANNLPCQADHHERSYARVPWCQLYHGMGPHRWGPPQPASWFFCIRKVKCKTQSANNY